MPFLFRRSNGVYYIAYDVDGKRKWKSTSERRKSEAVKVLVRLELGVQPQTHRVLLSRFIEEFLSSATASYSAGTIGIYKQALTRFLAVTGDRWVYSVTAKHIDLYKVARLKTLSPVTLNIELRTLRAAFNTALRWKLLTENPFRNVPLIRIPDQQPLHLTQEDFRKLLSVITEGWFKDLITVAVYTGLRRGELLNLQWKDVNFERKIICIQSSSDFRTKFGKRRIVPMNADVEKILRGRRQAARLEYVFARCGRRLLDSSVTHKFKAAVRKAGLNPDLHLHSLRHTFATWLVQNRISIYEVQKLLGHSSLKITEVYSHLLPEELHGTVNKIVLPESA